MCRFCRESSEAGRDLVLQDPGEYHDSGDEEITGQGYGGKSLCLLNNINSVLLNLNFSLLFILLNRKRKMDFAKYYFNVLYFLPLHEIVTSSSLLLISIRSCWSRRCSIALCWRAVWRWCCLPTALKEPSHGYWKSFRSSLSTFTRY